MVVRATGAVELVAVEVPETVLRPATALDRLQARQRMAEIPALLVAAETAVEMTQAQAATQARQQRQAAVAAGEAVVLAALPAPGRAIRVLVTRLETVATELERLDADRRAVHRGQEPTVPSAAARRVARPQGLIHV